MYGNGVLQAAVANRVGQIEASILPPRFADAVEQTAAEVASDQASLREYQRSRGFAVPVGVEQAEAGIFLSGPYPVVPCPLVEAGGIPTQIFEDDAATGDTLGRIASIVLGSQTVALDAEGNPLPL
jgi:hypothetical protein